MADKRSRRQFTPQQKAEIVKRHLVEKVPVSDLCDQFQIQPTLFYQWLKQLFENAPAAFEPRRKGRPAHDSRDQKIESLEAKLVRKNEVIGELVEALTAEKKKQWGPLTGRWVPHDTRDQVIDFVRHWREKTEMPAARFVPALGLGRSKFHDWTRRFGKVNEHNAWVPRDHWLTPDEAERIRQFARQNPLEGYRRMAFMMLDQDVVACSPASVYRVLSKAGLLYGPKPAARPAREPALSSPSVPTSIGTSTSAISTSAAPSTTSARCSTATAAASCTTKSANRCAKPTWKPSSSGPAKPRPAPRSA